MSFIGIYKVKDAANPQLFLYDLNLAYPMTIHRVLTDSSKKFTDRIFDLQNVQSLENRDYVFMYRVWYRTLI